MIQKGVVIGNTTPLNIDDLRYSYATLSNKLLAVTDASTAGTANGKQGDFADGTNAGDDYVYDDNGNLVIDLNKNVKELNNTAGANGIVYNFLDKPEQINLKGKGKITIVYDADGNKLQKIFTPIAPINSTLEVGNNFGTPITSTYINGFVYKADKLQFISTEEGRLRIIQATNTNNGYDNIQIDGTETMPTNGPNPSLGGRGTFDFFVRDYQSNVRMVLTEETHKGSNICTMETNRAANEEPIFGKTDANGVPLAGNEVQARFAASSIPGQAVGNGWAEPNIGNYVAKLYKGRRSTIGTDMGPASLLKVMAGDKVSATTIYYYQNPVANTTDNTSAINSILSSLTAAIGSSPVAGDAVHGAAGSITSNLGGSVPFTNITSPDAGNPAGTNPKAYLTVIFFDERFNFVPEASTTQRVQAAGNGQAPLVIADAKAPKNGYAYIYLSNESAEPVYFDNLRVVHERGRITEENHYYAYGLKIAGISSTKAGDVNEGELKNRRQYQGAFSEYDEDIQWNDFALRNYDPQTARWVQQDPYQQFASPYVALGGDPVNMVDPSGGWSITTGLFTGWTRLGVAAFTTLAGGILGNAAFGSGAGDGAKGMIVGAFLGLASNFSGGIVGAAVQAVIGVGKELANDAASMLTLSSKNIKITNTGVPPSSSNNPIIIQDGGRPNELYSSPEAAAINFAMYVEAVFHEMEYSSIIYSIIGPGGKVFYSFTYPASFEGTKRDDIKDKASPGPSDYSMHLLPPFSKRVGHIHTHTYNCNCGHPYEFPELDVNEWFGKTDKKLMNDKLNLSIEYYFLVGVSGSLRAQVNGIGIPIYLGTLSGNSFTLPVNKFENFISPIKSQFDLMPVRKYNPYFDLPSNKLYKPYPQFDNKWWTKKP